MSGVLPGETAFAKVNLTLHVTGRRADGYHALDSLVVFAGIGDQLSAEAGPVLSLSLSGPFAGALSMGADNLVLRAAEKLASATGVPPAAALHLEKELPVAAGIGGGSADAAAALRLLARLWQVTIPPDLPLALGADVPVCLAGPTPQHMQGAGEVLAPAPVLPPAWLLLVNPSVAVETAAVFDRLDPAARAPAPPVPHGFPTFHTLFRWLATTRNDLEPLARALCPAVGAVLEALAAAPIARMSGSGATCFALYPGRAQAEAHAARIAHARPTWWTAVAPVLQGG